MYLEHFGLREPPFRITPHTDFFYGGAKRGAMLDALIYAICHDEGIIKVTGEVGSGKTMLCRTLMERLPEEVATIYVANPTLSRDDILYTLAEELGISTARKRPSAVVRSLQDELIALHEEGRRVLVLIDEAHAMPPESLEEIRLLSNLETSRHKLMQIVLFGQPELDQLLAWDNLRQVRDRITQSFLMEPLRSSDVAEYVDFRMRAAGYRGPEVFSKGAIHFISRYSEGLTRRINILADKSLLAAYASGQHQVGSKQVRAAAKDADLLNKARTPLSLWVAGGLAAACAVAVFAIYPGKSGNATDPTPPSVSVESRPAMAGAASPPPLAAETPPIALTSLGPLTRTRLEASSTWRESTGDGRWVLQLHTSEAKGGDFIERYLGKAAQLVPEQSLYVLTEQGKNAEQISVCYGDFPSRQAAQAALPKLPEELRTFNPYPRQVRALKPKASPPV